MARLLPRNSRILFSLTSLSFLAFAAFFFLLIGWKLSFFELDSHTLIWHRTGQRPQWKPTSPGWSPQEAQGEVTLTSSTPAIDIETHTSHVAPIAPAMSSPSPPEALDAFLRRAKEQAMAHLGGSPMADGKDKLVLIMGNEAGDLDSAASAIGVSYLLNHFGVPPNAKGLPDPATTLYAPLIQSASTDLTLRPENKVAYASCHVQPDSLLFVSDLTSGKLSLDLKSSSSLSPSKNTFLGLVDHPSLTPSWDGASNPARKVVLLVDHHEDEGAHSDASLRVMKGVGSKDDKGEAIMPVGSASSLVVDIFKPLIEKQREGLPREVADLLISANIIDTDNLRRPPKGKASPIDVEAFNFLEPLSSFVPDRWATINGLALGSAPREVAASFEGSGNFVSGSVDGADALATQSYWGVLAASKAAVSEMDGRDLLRRDYKEVVYEPSQSEIGTALREASQALSYRFGFSSVPMGLAPWLHRERSKGKSDSAQLDKAQSTEDWAKWWETLVKWMQERKLDGAVVGTSFRDEGKHKRELLFAFSPLQTSHSRQLWTSMLDSLSSDAHITDGGLDPVNRLLLDLPWKGVRLSDTGKRERVAGLEGVDDDEAPTGLDLGGKLAAAAGRKEILAQVWRQTNDKASRKVVLPAVMHALQKAVKGL